MLLRWTYQNLYTKVTQWKISVKYTNASYVFKAKNIKYFHLNMFRFISFVVDAIGNSANHTNIIVEDVGSLKWIISDGKQEGTELW